MIGQLVTKLVGVVKTLNPDCIFEYEEARMINVKIDTVTRDLMFVYLEEPTQATLAIDLYHRTNTQTTVRLYFCRFEEMHNDNWAGDSRWNEKANITLHRQAIRDTIEETMVRPLIAILRKSWVGLRYPTLFNSLRILYPRPRFDANEVSVGIEFNLREDWCLKDYIPNIPDLPDLQDTTVALNWIDYLGNAVRNPLYEQYPSNSLFELPAIDPQLIAEMAVKDQVFEDWNTDWRGAGNSYQPEEFVAVGQSTLILWARFKSILLETDSSLSDNE